eukprot:9940171-Lingulodinium_polyedra.AAC.1
MSLMVARMHVRTWHGHGRMRNPTQKCTPMPWQCVCAHAYECATARSTTRTPSGRFTFWRDSGAETRD